MTYLTDIGRGWEGKFLSIDLEGHIRHLADVLTVDDILTMEGERRK